MIATDEPHLPDYNIWKLQALLPWYVQRQSKYIWSNQIYFLSWCIHSNGPQLLKVSKFHYGTAMQDIYTKCILIQIA